MFHGGLNGGAGVKKPRGLAAATLFGIVSLFGAGCGGAKELISSNGTGSIRTSVSLTAKSGGPAITRVQIEVEPAAVFQSLSFDSATGEYTGVVVVSTGTQTVTASAYAQTTLVGIGTADVSVTSHGTTTVLIKILDNSTPPAPQDHGPIITAITASSASVMTGDIVNLQVSATDADGDPITYEWTQDCGGVFSAPTSSTTTWSDISAESCVLTATAAAKGLSDIARISLAVVAGTGSVSVSALFVPVPYIRTVALNGGVLSCTVPRDATDASCRPAIAPSSILSASVTFDPMPADSGATVMLSDSCGGSSTGTGVDLVAGTASFDWTAPAATTSCLLTAAVSREGLSDAEQVAVAVQ